LNGQDTTFSAGLSGDLVSFKLFKFADVVCYGGIDQIIEVSGTGNNRIEDKKDSRCAVRNKTEMG
jgi:hypothetical protein